MQPKQDAPSYSKAPRPQRQAKGIPQQPHQAKRAPQRQPRQPERNAASPQPRQPEPLQQPHQVEPSLQQPPIQEQPQGQQSQPSGQARTVKQYRQPFVRALGTKKPQAQSAAVAPRPSVAQAKRPAVGKSSDQAPKPRSFSREEYQPSRQQPELIGVLRRHSGKLPAVLAAIVVLVVLLGVSQMFKSAPLDQAPTPQDAQPSQTSQTPSQSGGTQAPSPLKPAAVEDRSSYVLAAPSPAELRPKDAPLHGKGRDYELEQLIELQKRRNAAIDLKARDTWFARGSTSEWNYEPNGRKVVYLTFDDGPSPLTPQVLEVLDRYGAKATFFVTGSYPDHFDCIKKAYDAGHTIALHTASHDYSYLYSSEYAFFEDLAAIGSIVESQIGYVPVFTRFPGGTSNSISASYTPGIMSMLVNSVPAAGYQYYDWNSATYDALSGTTPTDEIIAGACGYTDENLIMLAHDSETKTTTVEALPAIIEHYLRLGYSFEAITPDTMVFHHEPVN